MLGRGGLNDMNPYVVNPCHLIGRERTGVVNHSIIVASNC